MQQSDEGILARVTTIASNVIGSWTMIAIQSICIVMWFVLDLTPSSPVFHFDNTRFDTLRLMLALQSVYTAPLILMAQRRIGTKDRKVLHGIDDYERQAMELRVQAMERRARLEEKIDQLLASKFDENNQQ